MHFRSVFSSRLRSFTHASAVLIALLFGASAGHAQSYDALIVFGDSYNDVGNISGIAAEHGISYPPAPYYYGRFSDGPIWIDDLAGALQLPIAASIHHGTDFAEGGAELLTATTLQGLPIPSVEDQVAYYLTLTGGKADPNALYVIEGGGNDILNATTFSPSTLGPAIAAGLVGIEKTLRAAGGTSFLIPQLIDVGQLPAAAVRGSQVVTFAANTSIAANQALAAGLAADSALPGIHIYNIPVFEQFLVVVTAPGAFGFTDTVDPCIQPGHVCAHPDEHLWWDLEHPTKYAHSYFAVLAGAALYYQK